MKGCLYAFALLNFDFYTGDPKIKCLHKGQNKAREMVYVA
jgi:hypothetical protein